LLPCYSKSASFCFYITDLKVQYVIKTKCDGTFLFGSGNSLTFLVVISVKIDTTFICV